MRLLIRLLIVVAVLWCGWWALASYGAAQAINAWVDDRRAAGWDITADTAQSGFPMNIQTNVTALSVRNPVAQSTLTVNGGALKARTYWPGYVDLDLPDTPMVLDLPGGRLALETRNATAALRLRPGFALELSSLRINSEGWGVVAYEQELLVSDDFTLLADQDHQDNARYAITLASTNLAPGTLPRHLLSLPETWPTTFEAFTASGSVTFDAPLTPASFEGTPPQLRGLRVQELDIIWGDLALRATGDLVIDPSGIPTGQMNLQARNWRKLLDVAEGAGALPTAQRGQVELVLGLLANRSGRPEDMDIDMTFQNGRMALSGIPLGSAPRLKFE